MCTFSDVRVALTVTKDIGDHLLICCRLRLIIHQHVSVGLCGDVLIHLHKMGTRSLAKIRSAIMSICFLSQGLRNNTTYCAFLLMSVLYFPFGNIFCSNKITLALR